MLHQLLDTAAAMADGVRKLRSGAPFQTYLYFRFDNRDGWFKVIWVPSGMARQAISAMPIAMCNFVAGIIVTIFYLPFARISSSLRKCARDVSNFQLSFYGDSSFYIMLTDAVDGFGTPVEHRFSRGKIRSMVERAGLEGIVFSDSAPFWVPCGHKHHVDD